MQEAQPTQGAQATPGGAQAESYMTSLADSTHTCPANRQRPTREATRHRVEYVFVWPLC